MALEPGQKIGGRYSLIGKLGAGGMADVWLANDEELGRRVALKFLHERFAQDAQFVERFRREAQSAAGLQHPNVVGVYDRGEDAGRHWIAMEYVEGAMLKDLIERGLSVAEAVEIVRQILVGAKFAHARGIVHRDLKPQNVLVDNEGRARVTDFGIARAGASEITATGSVLGTAQYLSPEQAQGLEITEASDLYSIGVILYEALTGQVPFDAETPVAVALKQVTDQPRPPSEINPAVPRSLDGIVLRALAKEPQNRFASAEEFLRALDIAEANPAGAALEDTASFTTPMAAGAGALAGGLAGAAAGAAMAGGPDDAAAAAGGAGAPGAVPGEGAGGPPDGTPPPGAAGAAEEGPGGWRGWFTRRRVIALAVVALAAAAVAAWALTRPEKLNVPSVIEQPVSVARTALEDRGFEVSEAPVPSCAPVDTVIEQDPLAGSEAEEGSEVELTVSLGRSVDVPQVRGETEAEATKILQRENLLVDTRKQASREVRAGHVITTEPPPGTEVECNSQVTLVVSKGQNLVTLPDLIGQSEEVAQSQLRRLDLIPDIETKDADEPEGTVIGQDPGPDSRLPRGETVTLIVSTGAGSIVVPDVEGQPRDTAASTLTGLGLNLDIVEQEVDVRSDDDRVLDQAPDPGTRLRAGDRVTIFVGVFVEPEPEPTTTSTTTLPEPETPVEPRDTEATQPRRGERR